MKIQKKYQGYYKCLCDCGEVCFVRPSFLKESKTYSCPNCRNNLLGRKLGKLLVEEKLYHKDAVYYYRCSCECGGSGVFSSKSLWKRKSCGCISKDKLPEGESILNAVIKGYKSGCVDRKLTYSLSREEFKTLCQGNCFYCGKPPSNIRTVKGKKFVYNGIDRINSDIGYFYNNCVTCCWTCNRMKHQMSVEDFINHIKLIIEVYSSKT